MCHGTIGRNVLQTREAISCLAVESSIGTLCGVGCGMARHDDDESSSYDRHHHHNAPVITMGHGGSMGGP